MYQWTLDSRAAEGRTVLKQERSGQYNFKLLFCFRCVWDTTMSCHVSLGRALVSCILYMYNIQPGIVNLFVSCLLIIQPGIVNLFVSCLLYNIQPGIVNLFVSCLMYIIQSGIVNLFPTIIS